MLSVQARVSKKIKNKFYGEKIEIGCVVVFHFHWNFTEWQKFVILEL